MSTTTAAEASLINDVEFLDELERFEHVAERAPDSGLDSRTFDDAFDALESGLPLSHTAQRFEAPHHERVPIGEPHEPSVERPVPPEVHIPFMAAALVLVGCLSVGAATAAFVFHDRVTQITALRPASR
jgi:hypothetical protein